MAAVVAMFGSNDGMRRVRERRLVGPAHNHDEEQHHLQQHLLPLSLSAIAMLLVVPMLIQR
jgi:hypothetical protein